MTRTSRERRPSPRLVFLSAPPARVPFLQWSEFHVVEPHSTDVCVQLDTESPGRAPRDFPAKARGVRWIQVSASRCASPGDVHQGIVWNLTFSSPFAGAIATISATIHWARRTSGRSWRMSFPTWKRVDWAWGANPNILFIPKNCSTTSAWCFYLGCDCFFSLDKQQVNCEWVHESAVMVPTSV